MNDKTVVQKMSLKLGLVTFPALVFFVLGIGFFLASNGSIGRPNLVILIALLIIANFGVVVAAVLAKQSKQEDEEKAKRSQNIYELMDELIADLSADEAVYLEALIDKAYGETSVSDEYPDWLEEREPQRTADVMQ